MSGLTQSALDKLLQAVTRAAKKAVGTSGHGTVTIDFKKFVPKILIENRDQEPID